MKPVISRRAFLKLASLLPLAGVPLISVANKAGATETALSQPNLLIIVLDALSARNMSLYGYPRRTTPQIERFAQKAVVYHRHYAGGNFTTPGTASLLTGVLPWTHHALNMQGTMREVFTARNLFALAPSGIYATAYSHNLLAVTLLYQLRESLEQLAMPRRAAVQDLEYSDLLFRNDYNTAFISENLLLRGKQVSGSLFLSFLYRWISQLQEERINARNKPRYPAGVPEQDQVFFTFEATIDWTIEQLLHLPQPYLAYFHYLPPHDPYKPPKGYYGLFNDRFSPPEKPLSFAAEGFTQGQLDEERLRYDRYLAFADSEFGRLIDALEQNGLLDNTYVILTSDHGELFERGIRGHITPVMYEPLVHVPLLISAPGMSARQDVLTCTSCVDVLPTILSFYGEETPPWCEGQPLPPFGRSMEDPSLPVFAMDNKSQAKNKPMTEGSFTVIYGDYKLIHYRRAKDDGPSDELYNLADDPEEMENLISTKGGIAAELRALIEQGLQRANQDYPS